MYVIHVSLLMSNKFLYVVFLICIATAPVRIVLLGNTFEDGMKCTTTEFQKELEDQKIGVQYIRKLGIYKTYKSYNMKVNNEIIS